MAWENQTILDTWQTRGIKKKEGASQTYDTPSRFKTYVKFAEYYKSVTKINCYVGKSFVSQFIVDSYGIGKFLQIKRNMNKKKAYGK